MPTEEHDHVCARCHRPVSFHPFADCPTPDVLARRPRATPAATFLQLMALSAIASSRLAGPSRPYFAAEGPTIILDSYRGPQPEPKAVVPRSKMRTAEENERRFKLTGIDQCADCGIFGDQLLGERVREWGALYQLDPKHQPTIVRDTAGRYGYGVDLSGPSHFEVDAEKL